MTATQTTEQKNASERDAAVVPLKNAQSEAGQPAAEEAIVPPRKKRGSRLFWLISVPLVIAVAGGYFYLTGGRYIETDNAYVHQPIVSLSSDVAGRITSVTIKENQTVKAGDVLFQIDPTTYQIAVDQAEAALAAARVNVEQLRVSYSTAQAKLEAAKLTQQLRQNEFDRQNNLVNQGVSSQASLDDVRLSLQTANSDVTLAEQEVASAVAGLAGDPDISTEAHPSVRTAVAQLDAAKRNLEKTTITAPTDGIVSQLSSLNVGQYVGAGTSMASLVETKQTWIEANFKETQLADIVDGMPAEVTIDAYPGQKFSGHVGSIGAATGAQFALIPTQNASGNWIKVTQRIPVVVTVDEETPVVLRAGMSAVVSVDSGKTVLDRMK